MEGRTVRSFLIRSHLKRPQSGGGESMNERCLMGEFADKVVIKSSAKYKNGEYVIAEK